MYTNDAKYQNIDQIRDKLRVNEYDHLNFDPNLRSPDGDIYFKEVYQMACNNQELIDKNQHDK